MFWWIQALAVICSGRKEAQRDWKLCLRTQSMHSRGLGWYFSSCARCPTSQHLLQWRHLLEQFLAIFGWWRHPVYNVELWAVASALNWAGQACPHKQPIRQIILTGMAMSVSQAAIPTMGWINLAAWQWADWMPGIGKVHSALHPASFIHLSIHLNHTGGFSAVP